MKVDLNERSSKILGMLSDKLDYPPEYVLRIAVFELARFMLGTPKEFIIFEKSEWDKTMKKIKGDIEKYWTDHPQEAERKGIDIHNFWKQQEQQKAA